MNKDFFLRFSKVCCGLTFDHQLQMINNYICGGRVVLEKLTRIFDGEIWNDRFYGSQTTAVNFRKLCSTEKPFTTFDNV